MCSVVSCWYNRQSTVVISTTFIDDDDDSIFFNRYWLTPLRATLAAKGLLGERYFLNGSMNLTVSGVSVNEEHVVLRLDPSLLAQQRLEFTERWEGKFQ